MGHSPSEIYRGVLPETSYRVTVRQRVNTILGEPATEYITTPAVPMPDQVENLSAIPFFISNTVSLAWSPVTNRPDLLHYRIERMDLNPDLGRASNWLLLANSKLTAMIDTGKIPGRTIHEGWTYWYRVRAECNNGDVGEWSDIDRVDLKPPDIPEWVESGFEFTTNPIFSLVGECQIAFQSDSGAEAYEVQAMVAKAGFTDTSEPKLDPNNPAHWWWWSAPITHIHEGGTKQIQYVTIPWLITNAFYTFRIQASNGTYQYRSGWSGKLPPNPGYKKMEDDEPPVAPWDDLSFVDVDIAYFSKDIIIGTLIPFTLDFKRYRLYELRLPTQPTGGELWQTYFNTTDEPGTMGNGSGGNIWTGSGMGQKRVIDGKNYVWFTRPYSTLISDYTWTNNTPESVNGSDNAYYCYWVASEDIEGNWLVPTNVTLGTNWVKMGTPDAPTGLVVESNLIFNVFNVLKVYSLEISWDNVGADQYQLEWKQKDFPWWNSIIHNEIPGQTSYHQSIPFAWQNEAYNVRVRGKNAFGWGDYAEYINATGDNWFVVTKDTVPPAGPIFVYMTNIGPLIICKVTPSPTTHKLRVYIDGLDDVFLEVLSPAFGDAIFWFWSWDVAHHTKDPDSPWDSHFYYVTCVDLAGNESTDYGVMGWVTPERFGLTDDTDGTVDPGRTLTVDGNVDVTGDVNVYSGGDVNIYDGGDINFIGAGTLNIVSGNIYMQSDSGRQIQVLANHDVKIQSTHAAARIAGSTGTYITGPSGGSVNMGTTDFSLMSNRDMKIYGSSNIYIGSSNTGKVVIRSGNDSGENIQMYLQVMGGGATKILHRLYVDGGIVKATTSGV